MYSMYVCMYSMYVFTVQIFIVSRARNLSYTNMVLKVKNNYCSPTNLKVTGLPTKV